MKTAVLYYSESGNTAKVAAAMAEAIGDGTALESLEDAPALDDYDLVFVGMPVIRFGAPEPAQQFLEEHCAGRRVALFVTHTAPDYLDQLESWLDACKDAASSAELVGFFHCQGALAEPIKQWMLNCDQPMLVQFAQMSDCALGQPDDAALQRAREFAAETVTQEWERAETMTTV